MLMSCSHSCWKQPKGGQVIERIIKTAGAEGQRKGDPGILDGGEVTYLALDGHPIGCELDALQIAHRISSGTSSSTEHSPSASAATSAARKTFRNPNCMAPTSSL